MNKATEPVKTVSLLLDRELVSLRAELHRYCARMLGSVFDGEDVVQDAMTSLATLMAAGRLPDPLRPWLFRVAHNSAIDRIRRNKLRMTESIDAAGDVASQANGTLDELIAREAMSAALSRFMALPLAQRSAVILKDVLGHSLESIADLLGSNVGAVKALLSRGRKALGRASALPIVAQEPPSAELLQYIALFNDRDWESLERLLAADVELVQTARAERRGRSSVAATFFGGYAESKGWRLEPARLEGREVAAVLSTHGAVPAYFMALAWTNGQVRQIRDFRYARYVMESAEIELES